MIIYPSNAIRFYEIVPLSTLPTFDNTAAKDMPHLPYIDASTGQFFELDQEINIQVIALTGATVIVSTDAPLGVVEIISNVVLKTIEDEDMIEYDIIDITIKFNNPASFTLTLTDAENSWQSECLNARSKWFLLGKGYVKISHFSDGVKNNIDYSGDIVFENYIKSKFFEYDPASEIVAFENDEEDLKLKEVTKRVLLFNAFELSPPTVEQLKLAMASDHFLVNEVEFVQLEGFEVTYFSNYAQVSVPVREKRGKKKFPDIPGIPDPPTSIFVGLKVIRRYYEGPPSAVAPPPEVNFDVTGLDEDEIAAKFMAFRNGNKMRYGFSEIDEVFFNEVLGLITVAEAIEVGEWWEIYYFSE